MAATQTLILHLPDDVTALVRAAVENGEYASPDEVVQDALRGWTELRAEPDLEVLRSICQAAIDNTGPGLAAAPVFARLKQRFAIMAEGTEAEVK